MAKEDAAKRQTQAVERSPRLGARPKDPTDEHTADGTNTMTSGGLAGGSPAGGPRKTPERTRLERRLGIEPRVRSGRADRPVQRDED